MAVKYLSVDCETGGLDTRCSLLTIGLVFADEQFSPVELPYHLHVKPNDGIYVCTGESFKYHRINLEEHDKIAIPYKEAGSQIYKLLEKYTSDDGNKLIVIGKNVRFDLQFLWEHVITRNTWENFCSYRLLDVTSTSLFMQDIGLIPSDVSCSLESLVEYYGVYPLPSHDAVNDALMTLAVQAAITRELKLRLA